MSLVPVSIGRLLPAVAILLTGPALAAAPDGAAHAGPPEFLLQLTLLLAVSALAAYSSFRLRLIPIIGFLVAGVLAGPGALGLIRDPALISSASEVGVMLLLFTIGIEFSLERLSRIARLIFLGGGLQVGLTIVAVTGALLAFGVGAQSAVFTGCLIALSSTAIVMRVLGERGETNARTGQVSLGILIFQDLAVVLMVLLIPMLAGQGGGAGGVLLALAKAGGIIAFVLVAARRIVPPVMEVVARTCSSEIFLLTVVALCFGTAALTALAGVSLALGAFLAGLLVSESRYGAQALGEILPLQILFSAAFFLSVGVQLDLGFLVRNLGLVLGAAALIALLKAAVAFVSVRLLGEPTRTALPVALGLAQVGEFSFVLATTGAALGLSFAGMGERGSGVFIAATVLLMAFTPALSALAGVLTARLTAPALSGGPGDNGSPGASGEGGAHGLPVRDRVIFAGYGPYARIAARALSRAGKPYSVITRSPDGASELQGRGAPVLIADYTRAGLLRELDIASASALVIADDDPEMTERAVSVARTVAPDLTIITQATTSEGFHGLQALGAQHIISPRKEVVAGILDLITPPEVTRAHILRHLAEHPPITLSATQRAQCEHAEHNAGPVTPEADVCLECVALGDTWVHLRVCMTCGHVGCCDSSKNRHATRHAHAQRHPIIRSAEPGEDWAYCYEHGWTK
ncbi:CPA2 family monovalent cation:H+ antiporter-2 [Deinococcus metalli]|uniref:CPA2 family monovalent cation:H+ antiporter-2 n=1 Tax=Deinococcus metalli TaxID=1141878 RepID=A0A7W8KDW2_9DEIO|nr:cation:proton antiporter [Deinococcus metalli]MBB5374729.1 CPA2 family monovalent cation:H+ antiporter-2 [Deinococcus metalli]GHF34138.1 potassium transporter KefB [Deinococcus metalli]